MSTPKELVREAIDNGCVTNQEISTVLGGLEQSLNAEQKLGLHDAIADSARYYTLNPRPGFVGRCYLAAKDLTDRAGSLASTAYGAGAGACYTFGKALANSSLGGLVDSNSVLYDLVTTGKIHMKEGNIGFDAIFAPVQAIPSAVVGMVVGAATGWAAYKIATRSAGYVWNKWRKNVTSDKIVNKFGLDAASSNPPARPIEANRSNPVYITS